MNSGTKLKFQVKSISSQSSFFFSELKNAVKYLSKISRKTEHAPFKECVCWFLEEVH